ncbi:lysis protein [Escherichia coli]|uniref:lysis system i-spanin subunit Rz n=1 Tax=Escherichia coli TaxID=562 RepID=UPI001C9AE45F|nr:lysis protein [Escherichia coli]
MKRVLYAVIVILLVVSGALLLAIAHYRDNAIIYKEQRDDAKTKLSQANAAITDMQQRQRDITALDAKYLKELGKVRISRSFLPKLTR